MRRITKSKWGRKSDEEQILGFIYWSMLPEDLKVEILCRLKCKHLIRLKCVSKSWHLLISNQCASIISSPRLYGIIMSIRVIAEDRVAALDCCIRFERNLIQGWMCGPNRLLKKLVPFNPQPESIQDCSNGILLIANLAMCPRQYYVCNVTTHQCIEIPVNVEHYVHTYNASLVFDPRDMNGPNSFMVVVPREYSKHSLKLDVFSSRVRNWSSYMVPLDSLIDGSKLKEQSVYLNGILYMLSEDIYLVSVSLTSMQGKSTSSGRTLLETAGAIELPGKNKFESCGSFGVSKGNLVYSNSNCLNILVWVLETGARWVVRNRISVRKLIANPIIGSVCRFYLKSLGLMKVCAFHPYSEKIFLAGGTIQILKYSPRTKKLRSYRIVCCSNRVDKAFPVPRCAFTLDSV